MKLVSDWWTHQDSKTKKTRHLSQLVTSIGVINRRASDTGALEEGWSLRRAKLVVSTEMPSAAMSVSLITVKDEQMCVTCSWQECVVHPGLTEGLMGNLEQWLIEFGA